MLTYITAFFNIGGTRITDDFICNAFKHFNSLCDLNINIHLFIEDLTLLDKIKKDKVANVHIQQVSFTEMKTYKLINSFNYILPNVRTEIKDTSNFIILQNCKTEFLKMGAENNVFSAQSFAWIDFRIFHCLANTDGKYLEYIGATNIKGLAAPGCWSLGTRVDNIYDMVNWRFCGGFLAGDREYILHFYNLCFEKIRHTLATTNKLIWEVNIWHLVEIDRMISINWWNAGHDATIIELPREYFTTPAVCNFDSSQYDTLFKRTFENYIPSSASFLEMNNKRLLNVRFVNYELTPEGRYIIHNGNGWLQTENICYELDTSYNLIEQSAVQFETSCNLERKWSEIQGLEDVRLYPKIVNEITENIIGFIATQREYSSERVNRMVIGNYCIDGSGRAEKGSFTDCAVIEPPVYTACEKNWAPIVCTEQLFIYRWFPMEIGKIINNKLQIVKVYDVPKMVFNGIKGSTIFREYDDENGAMLIGIVHYSIETCPRSYYHQIVWLDKISLKPVKISIPFHFFKEGIEFCIGMTVIGDKMRCWLSRHDCNTTWIEFNYKKIGLYNIQ